MAFGALGIGPWLHTHTHMPCRSTEGLPDLTAAMTLLLPLLLILAALTASSAAPTSGAAPAWPTPRGAGSGGSGLGGGSSATSLGAALGGGLGAGLGGRTLGELAESELERYAFLMLDPAGGDVPTGAVTRRITPKSVFIAPSINGERDQCAEGYQQDDMGRCVKVVKVDAEKSWDLLLDKLTSQFSDLPLPLPEQSEPTPPPGPPPGPFQLNIPIAGVVDSAPSSESSQPAAAAVAETAVSEQATETVTEAAETTPLPEEADTPVPTPAAEDVHGALVPEVVMLTSEEQAFAVPGPGPAPAAQSPATGAYLVNGAGVEIATPAAPAALAPSNEVPVGRPVQPASAPATLPDVADPNPIINTVNNSPLVTGESLVQEGPASPSQLVADASSQQLQQLLAAALGLTVSTTERPVEASVAASLTPSSPASSTTESSLAPSSVAPSSATPPLSSTEAATAPSPSSGPEDASPSSTAAPASAAPAVSVETSTASPSSTTTTTTQLPPSTTTTTTTTASPETEESRPSSSNLLRPNPASPPLSALSRIPVIAPEVVGAPLRFPAPATTERPGGSGLVRFPSIEVTFPTSPGGGGDANRLLLDKPVVFPKDSVEKPSPWWPPLPPAPAFISNWGLEQTRNRPQNYRYWSRSPSRFSHHLSLGGANALGGLSSPSSSSSSSLSSSSSSSQETSQALRRTLANPHPHRGSSSSSHSHRGSSHRRGRDW